MDVNCAFAFAFALISYSLIGTKIDKRQKEKSLY